MKNSIFKAVLVLSVIALVGFESCNEKKSDHGFVVPKDKPAQALTIGWYVPVTVLKEIVGPHFEPTVIKDDSIGTIMIRIVSGEGHKVDSLDCGVMKAAYLMIPVIKPANMKFADANSITNSLVCAMAIVDQSPVLGNKFDDFGFPTYTGKINLDAKWSGEKYHVTASIETANGKIDIVGQFEEKPEPNDLVTAIFNPKASTFAFMYGKEHFQQIINGKGNLKTEGDNMIKAMNLSGHPYYLKLDLDLNWVFDFEKE
jgi:uncharacterized cupin superfamily protein